MARIKYYNHNTDTWDVANVNDVIITDAECESLLNLLNTIPDTDNEYASVLE